MKNKKILAYALVATMVAGSSMTVFAADGATGTGTLIPHLDKDVITVTLPTDAQVQNVFDFTIDPEQLIKDAGELTNGTAVTGNADGVYFKNAGSAAVNGTAAYSSTTNTTGTYTVTGFDLTVNDTYTYSDDDDTWTNTKGETVTATVVIKDESDMPVSPAANDKVTVTGATPAVAASYSSSSDTVTFAGNNSVDVDIKVEAEVEASAANAKDIVLVADEDALEASTVPALLMTLKAGTDVKTITTSAKATATAVIKGVPENFEVRPNGAGTAYEYKVKTDADESKWDSATIQLVGKTNNVSVPTGDNALTAPKIKLTWTVAKSTTPAGPTLSNATANATDEGIDFNATFTKGTALTCAFTGLGDGVTIKSVKWGTSASAATSTSTNITTTGASFTIASNMWGSVQAGDFRYLNITTSDDKTYAVKVTVR